MSSYFFETSALAKRYIQESGSSWVSSICEEAAGHLIFIADITEVELVSALYRRRKGGSLTKAVTDASFKQFDTDLSNQYVVFDLGFTLVSSARGLVESHALRGYDAVQLASALKCSRERKLRGYPAVTFVSSDNELLDAA